MRDIERCRTSSLGEHVDYCEHGCGYLSISYNSCRNRHCPKCQSLKQAKWLEERRERLLPTHYFHLVVTLPHELNPLALFNKELVFNLFFAAASRALRQFARDYDRLRAQVGFTAVLHTWDQNLNFHPHLHIVVTGGGLSADADTWIAAGNSFLLPVKALSKIIRAKFLEALDQAFQEDRLQGNVSCLAGPVPFRRFLENSNGKNGSSTPKSFLMAPRKPIITLAATPTGWPSPIIGWLAWRMARSPSEPGTIADPVSSDW